MEVGTPVQFVSPHGSVTPDGVSPAALPALILRDLGEDVVDLVVFAPSPMAKEAVRRGDEAGQWRPVPGLGGG